MSLWAAPATHSHTGWGRAKRRRPGRGEEEEERGSPPSVPSTRVKSFTIQLPDCFKKLTTISAPRRVADCHSIAGGGRSLQDPHPTHSLPPPTLLHGFQALRYHPHPPITTPVSPPAPQDAQLLRGATDTPPTPYPPSSCCDDGQDSGDRGCVCVNTRHNARVARRGHVHIAAPAVWIPVCVPLHRCLPSLHRRCVIGLEGKWRLFVMP